MNSKLLSGVKITLAIVLVVVTGVFAYLITPIFGNKVLIVRSGSMSPSLPVGSLVAIRPKEALRSPLPAVPVYHPGDVISFRDPLNSKTITTHRVVSAKTENYSVLYQTKGDANNDTDQSLVAEKNVLGAAFLTVPYLGQLFSFTKTAFGFLLLVLMPAIFVILMESWNIIRELRKKKPIPYFYLKDFKNSVTHGPTLTSLIPLLAIGLIFSQTFAYFSDTATSTSNVFAASAEFPNQNIADHVVISEVQITGGPGSTNNDFIELYNPTDSPINLDPYILVKRSGSSTTDTTIVTFTSTHIIPAQGFFLWANSSFTSISADIATTDILASSNSIALKVQTSGVIVDALSWNNATESYKEGTEFSPDPDPGSSMERKALSTSTAATMVSPGIDATKGNGHDTNNNSTDFILRPVSQPQNSTSGGTESP